MLFLIASFFCRWVVSRGMVITGVFLVSRVVRNIVLRVHTLALKVWLCLFHSTTSVLSQCKNFLPSLWLPCIYLLVLLSDLRHALYLNILPQNYQLPRWSLLVDCCVSIVRFFCLRGGIHKALGVLLGSYVRSVLLGGGSIHSIS